MSKVVFLDPIARKAKTDATRKSVANVPLRTPLQSWHASTSSALLLRLWLLS